MYQMSHFIKLAVALTLMFSVGLNVFLMWFYPHEKGIDYRKRYQPYVQMAEALWVKRNEGTSDLKIRHPVGITFPNKVCVSLPLERGAIGAVPVYCFRMQDHELIERYDELD